MSEHRIKTVRGTEGSNEMIRERGRRKEEIINDRLEGDSGKKRGEGGGEMDCGVHARLPCHAMPCGGGGGGGAPACPPGGPGWTYLCHVRQTAAAATRVSKPIQGYP